MGTGAARERQPWVQERTCAAWAASRRAEQLHTAQQRERPLHRRHLRVVKAANIAPHLFALALHPDKGLPLAACRRPRHPSVAALVVLRQLELQPARAARAIEDLVLEGAALAAPCLAHLFSTDVRRSKAPTSGIAAYVSLRSEKRWEEKNV